MQAHKNFAMQEGILRTAGSNAAEANRGRRRDKARVEGGFKGTRTQITARAQSTQHSPATASRATRARDMDRRPIVVQAVL